MAVTILIVDDEESIRNLIAKSLKRSKYEVMEASNGIEALKILESRRIDLIVIDLVMPGKGGIETLIEIHERFPELKRIAISGKIETSNDSIKEVIEQFKVDAVFSKPFDIFDLLNKIKAIVNAS